MKQALIPKPELIQKTKFNHSRNESLKILSFNHEELKVYLQEQMNQNPFLHVTQSEADADSFLSYDHSKESLYDVILSQLQLQSQRYNQELCEALLSQLDSNGYFKESRLALLKSCNCSEAELTYHLNLLHTLEPYGAFAFDLKDCLRIQCQASEHPASETAIILCDELEELALRRWDSIIAKTQLTYEEIQEGFHFIQSCNPKPCANYAIEAIYMLPEFKVEVIDGNIQIQRIKDDFTIQLDMESIDRKQELNTYLKAQREQVKNIINSIAKRNMTLLQIMNCICEIQQDFFLKHAPLQHMTLEMAAKRCGLHISTISRAITNKAFEFEHHYYPMKKMFVSGGASGISQDEIKKRIRSIIQEEDKKHPYSDEAIRTILESEGIQLSRRAVAKYREACYLFNSSKRKLL